jgi:hypothetical protein
VLFSTHSYEGGFSWGMVNPSPTSNNTMLDTTLILSNTDRSITRET